jgi:hypothetical protein
MRDPDARGQRRLPDVQRRDPLCQRARLFDDLFHPHWSFRSGRYQAGCPREPRGGSEAESRARGNNAGPLRQAPSARLLCGLSGTKHRRLRRAPHPIFTLSGCRATGTTPMFVKAFFQREIHRICRLLGKRTRQGRAARDGGQALIRSHEVQQECGKGGPGRRIDRRPAPVAAADSRARPPRELGSVSRRAGGGRPRGRRNASGSG